MHLLKLLFSDVRDRMIKVMKLAEDGEDLIDGG